MSRREKEFTGEEKCLHCNNTARMEIVSRYSQGQTYYDEGPRSFISVLPASWEAGWVYELLKCPACFSITLRRFHYHELTYTDQVADGTLQFETLYPSPPRVPLGLPEPIRQAYERAHRLRHVDENAYGNELGRLLGMICNDRGAKGRSLYDKLQDLERKGDIPHKIVQVADKLRAMRNVGDHAELGTLGPQEVPIAYNLCLVLLDYIYTAPCLIKEAERRLEEISPDR